MAEVVASRQSPVARERAVSPASKTAIVLFNLGGPDSLAAVQPFLFNLFNDPAIIGLPWPFRGLLARLISKKRAPKAAEIYKEMGGKSPILPNTLAQAAALEASLAGHGQAKVFVCMRYWHPFADAVAREVKAYAPDHIILLPLYPQFSTTTTGSSFKDWGRAAAKAGLKNTPTSQVCCYPTHPEFAKSYAGLIRSYYDQAAQYGTPRILFSAHGLPEKVVKRGDPYQWQVEETTKAVMKEFEDSLCPSSGLDSSPLEGEPNRSCDLVGGKISVTGTGNEIPPTKSATSDVDHKQCGASADLAPPQGGSYRASGTKESIFDYVNCYQSRVGPLTWIGPATDQEIIRAAKEGKPIVLVPIAFVSEHSETLVELDIEYKHLAHEHGGAHYFRVPTVSVEAHFIAALTDLCLQQARDGGLAPDGGKRLCGDGLRQCACKQ